jgi:hypothetical protein
MEKSTPSLLHNANIIDFKYPEEKKSEIDNLRILNAHYEEKIRMLERELARRGEDFMNRQVLHDGLDLHPAWDYIARDLSPAPRRCSTAGESPFASKQCVLLDGDSLETHRLRNWLKRLVGKSCLTQVDQEEQRITDRDACAEICLLGAYDSATQGWVRLLLVRMASAMKGKKFCDDWGKRYHVEIYRNDTKGIIAKIRNHLW